MERFSVQENEETFRGSTSNATEYRYLPLFAERGKENGEEELEWSNVEKAACLVEQALHGRSMPLEIIHSENIRLAHKAFLYYHHLGFVRFFVFFIFLILPFFEKPLWCKFEDESQPCGDPSVYPLSGLPYLSSYVVLLIEGICVLLLTGVLALQKCYIGTVSFKKNRVYIYKCVLLGFIVISRIFFILKSFKILPDYNFELTPYIRTFLAILFSKSIRGCFRTVFRILAGFLDILILLSLFIVFFSWLAFLIFGRVGLDVSGGDPEDEEDIINNPFRSFLSSLLSLFILLTTANNPNVWIDLYVRYRASFIFFFLYISIGLFILMNLILSVIYNGYKTQMNAHKEKKINARQDALMCAFDLLDERQHGWLDASQLNKLFLAMKEFKHLPNVRNIASEVFLLLDECGDFCLHPREFSNLCDVLERRIMRSTSKPRASRTILRSSNQSWLHLVPLNLQTFVRSKIFDAVCDIGLVLAFGIIVIETMVTEDYIKNELIEVEYVIGLVWICEIISRMLVYGFRPFFKRALNKFDSLILLFLIWAEFDWLFSLDELTDLNWIRYALSVRMIRLVFLSSQLPRMRMIYETFASLFPVVLPVLGLQLCVCSLFSLLGVHIFGGAIYYGNPLLEGSEYSEAHFEVINYNDFASAMVTSFCLCVVNDWYIFMEGHVAATSQWARLFFISFYIIAVVFVLNVVVAFVLENILDEAERTAKMVERGDRKSVDSVRGALFLSRPHFPRNFSFDHVVSEGEESIRQSRHGE